MQNSIEHSFSTEASAGEIWNSLTDRDELENWWGEGIILEPKVGGRFCEPWQDDDGVNRKAIGKVISLKPQKEIVFTWTESEWPKSASTQCSFFIKDDGKTRTLTMKHEGWESLPEELRSKTLKDFNVGWTFHLRELKSYLDE